MSRKPEKSRRSPAAGTADHSSKLSPSGSLFCSVVAVCWFLVVISVSTRVHLVMGYSTLVGGAPHLEPLLATSGACLFAGVLIAAWIVGGYSEVRSSESSQGLLVSASLMLAACLPSAAISLGSILNIVTVDRFYWEPLWISGWTGLSSAYLATRILIARDEKETQSKWPAIVVVGSSVCVGGWWFWQALSFHSNFLLGFNDFGHFGQRIANTAAGRGFLLETPVLPPFWDHFNPGLILLVPLWLLWQDERLFFAIQAACLSGSAALIYVLARRLGHSGLGAATWALAWLAQPALGQMNLAYTYGWHPITIAIPLLLVSLVFHAANRTLLAMVFAVVAMSMEEGVIIIVALFCATCALACLFSGIKKHAADFITKVGLVRWGLASAIAAMLFLLVYFYSGLREFQTGRFTALGDSAAEVLLSPVVRPSAFWGQLLRVEKVAFVASLLLPCGVLSLRSGWVWLLPSVLPMGVLLVWDHLPAASLAFQYPSILLPVFWLAALMGSLNGLSTEQTSVSKIWMMGRGEPAAVGALVTGLMLSLFVGQLPYSSPTLLDVEARTYHADSSMRRNSSQDDGRWLLSQLEQVEQDLGTVLATGRIASHLVGNEDVETVGQYFLRLDQLTALPQRNGNPLMHYEWIVLDRLETFQQTQEETLDIERQAKEAGYEIVDDQYDVILLRNNAL